MANGRGWTATAMEWRQLLREYVKCFRVMEIVSHALKRVVQYNKDQGFRSAIITQRQTDGVILKSACSVISPRSRSRRCPVFVKSRWLCYFLDSRSICLKFCFLESKSSFKIFYFLESRRHGGYGTVKTVPLFWNCGTVNSSDGSAIAPFAITINSNVCPNIRVLNTLMRESYAWRHRNTLFPEHVRQLYCTNYG